MSRINGEQVQIHLAYFIRKFGAPSNINFDVVWLQVDKNAMFMTALRRYEVKWHISQPYRPNENPSEAAIQYIKKKVYHKMAKKGIPERL